MTCCKCRKFFWPIRQGTATTRPSLLSLLAVCFDAPHVRVCVAIMCALSVAVATCRSSKWLELHSHLRRNCVCSGQLTTVRTAFTSVCTFQPTVLQLVQPLSTGECNPSCAELFYWPMHTRKSRPRAVAARHLLFDEWVCEWYPFLRQVMTDDDDPPQPHPPRRCCLLLAACCDSARVRNRQGRRASRG
jgi:hypothetical protein